MIRSKKGLGILGGFLALWFGLSLYVPATVSAKEPISIRAVSFYPLKHRVVLDCFNLYDQEINKRTNGKVQMKWFHGCSLVSMDKMVEAVQSGMADMGWIAMTIYPHLFPVGVTPSMPFMLKDTLHGTGLLYKMYEEVPEFRDELSDFKVLGFGVSDMYNIAFVNKIAVKTPDELKGMRVAGGGPQTVNLLKYFPCAATYVKEADLYLSLQRKMVDALAFANAPLRSWKLVDVTQGHTMCNMTVDTFVVIMNKQKWESLPEDVKKVFDDLNPSMPMLAENTIHNEGQWVIEALKKRGDAFYYPTSQEMVLWKNACKGQYDAHAKLLDDRGMKGEAIVKKISELAEETRDMPHTEFDDWWKASRMGKLKK